MLIIGIRENEIIIFVIHDLSFLWSVNRAWDPPLLPRSCTTLFIAHHGLTDRLTITKAVL